MPKKGTRISRLDEAVEQAGLSYSEELDSILKEVEHGDV